MSYGRLSTQKPLILSPWPVMNLCSADGSFSGQDWEGEVSSSSVAQCLVSSPCSSETPAHVYASDSNRTQRAKIKTTKAAKCVAGRQRGEQESELGGRQQWGPNTITTKQLRKKEPSLHEPVIPFRWNHVPPLTTSHLT